MAISLHDALVPSFRQVIGASLGLLTKAEAFCTEKGHAPEELIGHSLAPDMLSIPFQVKSIAGHSIGAIEGVRKGTYSPDMPPPINDFAGLKAILTKADADLAALDPAELDGYVGGDMLFQMRDMKMPFTVENFLLSFSQPNFYFHATMLYAILRNKGVPLGKRDFLGMPRMKV